MLFFNQGEAMNTGIRIKSLNGDTYTETVIKDGKTFINVYGPDGQLIGRQEQDCQVINIIWQQKSTQWVLFFYPLLIRFFCLVKLNHSWLFLAMN